jgi:hypothetical protein
MHRNFAQKAVGIEEFCSKEGMLRKGPGVSTTTRITLSLEKHLKFKFPCFGVVTVALVPQASQVDIFLLSKLLKHRIGDYIRSASQFFKEPRTKTSD